MLGVTRHGCHSRRREGAEGPGGSLLRGPRPVPSHSAPHGPAPPVLPEPVLRRALGCRLARTCRSYISGGRFIHFNASQTGGRGRRGGHSSASAAAASAPTCRPPTGQETASSTSGQFRHLYATLRPFMASFAWSRPDAGHAAWPDSP